jgi:hypothetical protein
LLCLIAMFHARCWFDLWFELGGLWMRPNPAVACYPVIGLPLAPIGDAFWVDSLTAATDVLAIPVAGFHDAHNCGKTAHDATYILSTAELRADGFLSRRVATTRYLVLIRSEEAPNPVAQIGTGATLADNYGIPSCKPTLSVMREYRLFSSVHNMGGHGSRPSGFEPFRRPDLLAAGWHGAVV